MYWCWRAGWVSRGHALRDARKADEEPDAPSATPDGAAPPTAVGCPPTNRDRAIGDDRHNHRKRLTAVGCRKPDPPDRPPANYSRNRNHRPERPAPPKKPPAPTWSKTKHHHP